MVRKASFRIRWSLIASAMAFARIRVRNNQASLVSETTSGERAAWALEDLIPEAFGPDSFGPDPHR